MGILASILAAILPSIFGHDPIAAVVKGLNQAYSDKLNAKTTEETINANERIDRMHSVLADLSKARDANNDPSMPGWLRVLAFMIGFPFALHVLMIGLGTCLQPWIVNGWFDGLLHIPAFPKPFDTQEANVIGYFYGFGAAVVVTTAAASVVKSIARR